MAVLLALLVGLPLLAGLAATTLLRTRAPIGLAVATGTSAATALVAASGAVALGFGVDPPELAPVAEAGLRLDPTAALLAVIAALVTATVTAYARRNLDGDGRAGRFAAAALLLLLATLVMATATSLQVAGAGWLLASAATLWLCAYRGDEAARRTVRRALVPVIAGDLAIVAAIAVATGAAGSVPFASIDDELAGTSLPGPLSIGVGSVVVALVALAALARAGQLPFRPWMGATVDAPTPVSALLHAGSVNAGGFLLVRSSDLLWNAPGVRIALGLTAAATMALAAAGAAARPDAKGRLATSTAGQMGLMLLAAAVGAPAAVLTHLAGHSLYKSASFLGAGATVRRAVGARRASEAAIDRRRAARVALTGAATGTAIAAWWAVSTAAEVAPVERGVTAALAGGIVAGGAWFASSTTGPRALARALTTATAAVVLALGALAADAALPLSHPELAGGDVAGLVLAGLALAMVALLGRPGPIEGAALRWAVAPVAPPGRRSPALRPLPALVPAELGRSW